MAPETTSAPRTREKAPSAHDPAAAPGKSSDPIRGAIMRARARADIPARIDAMNTETDPPIPPADHTEEEEGAAETTTDTTVPTMEADAAEGVVTADTGTIDDGDEAVVSPPPRW